MIRQNTLLSRIYSCIVICQSYVNTPAIHPQSLKTLQK